MSTSLMNKSTANPLTLRRNELLTSPISVAKPEQKSHLVQFYDTDDFLIHSLAIYVHAGLDNKEAVVIIATQSHLEQLSSQLLADGIDANAARIGGQLIFLDAASTLRSIMVGKLPSADRFDLQVGGLIRRMIGKFGAARAYGEMVGILWDSGNLGATLALEELWNGALRNHPKFSLLCGYRLGAFDGSGNTYAFQNLCTSHTHVLPSETYLQAEEPDDQLRKIAQLERKANSLAVELARSHKLETTLRESQDLLKAELIERRRSETDLRRYVSARDEFLSIASHELKTPMTSLKMQLQMMREKIRRSAPTEINPEKIIKSLDDSCKHVTRLAALVDDMFDVTKIQAGQLSIALECIDISQPIKDTLQRFEDELKLAKCSLSINVTDGIEVYADRNRIEQVVANLLSNAIKYAPGTAIEVELLPRGRNVRLCVRDFGPGVPLDRREIIFERFERSTLSQAISGLGLGLFIVRQIAQAHRGEVRIEDVDGPGTKFVVEIPIANRA